MHSPHAARVLRIEIDLTFGREKGIEAIDPFATERADDLELLDKTQHSHKLVRLMSPNLFA